MKKRFNRLKKKIIKECKHIKDDHLIKKYIQNNVLFLTFVFCIYFLNRLFCRLCCYRFPMEMFSPFSPLNAPAIFASSCASSHLLDAAKSLSSFNKCGCSIG